jgi:transposase
MDAPIKGQPLKLLRPGVKEKILTALSKGATYNLTCGYAGIGYNTFNEWMKKGKALTDMFEEQIENHPHKVYYDLYCDVKRVESYAALKWLEKIDAAANVHWQAAAWKLERRYPNEYGRIINESKEESEDNTVKKARSEVLKLKGDDHGRSPATTN